MQGGRGTGASIAEQARRVTAAAATALGVEPTAEAFGAAPDERFLELLPALAGLDLRTADATDPLVGLSPFGLVLPVQPADALAGGPAVDVDLLIGTNTEEGHLYLVPQHRLEPSTALDGRLGATHTVELPFVFDLAHEPGLHGDTGLLGPAPAPARLAARMHGAWVAFAATGAPGWAPHHPQRPGTEVFGGRG